MGNGGNFQELDAIIVNIFMNYGGFFCVTLVPQDLSIFQKGTPGPKFFHIYRLSCNIDCSLDTSYLILDYGLWLVYRFHNAI